MYRCVEYDRSDRPGDYCKNGSIYCPLCYFSTACINYYAAIDIFPTAIQYNMLVLANTYLFVTFDYVLDAY